MRGFVIKYGFHPSKKGWNPSLTTCRDHTGFMVYEMKCFEFAARGLAALFFRSSLTLQRSIFEAV